MEALLLCFKFDSEPSCEAAALKVDELVGDIECGLCTVIDESASYLIFAVEDAEEIEQELLDQVMAACSQGFAVESPRHIDAAIIKSLDDMERLAYLRQN